MLNIVRTEKHLPHDPHGLSARVDYMFFEILTWMKRSSRGRGEVNATSGTVPGRPTLDRPGDIPLVD